MLRPLLTIVLSAILALPQGICLCHFVEAAQTPPAQETGCCDETQPPPAQTPHDDDEHDCPCKLRAVLACDAAPVEVERGAAASLDMLAGAAVAVHDVDALSCRQTAMVRSLDAPVPLILCALRI